MDTEKIADNARWESYYDRKDQEEEREIRQQLDELRLDGTYDHYLREFFSLSDADIERLSSWYDTGGLCRPLADAYVKVDATVKTLDEAERSIRREDARKLD